MQKAIQIDQTSANLFFKFLELTCDCPKLLGLHAKRPVFFLLLNFLFKTVIYFNLLNYNDWIVFVIVISTNLVNLVPTGLQRSKNLQSRQIFNKLRYKMHELLVKFGIFCQVND